jgi:hypothetical protein
MKRLAVIKFAEPWGSILTATLAGRSFPRSRRRPHHTAASTFMLVTSMQMDRWIQILQVAACMYRAWRPQTNVLVRPERKVGRAVRRPSDSKACKSDYPRR